jgi:hypothetical protein
MLIGGKRLKPYKKYSTGIHVKNKKNAHKNGRFFAENL